MPGKRQDKSVAQYEREPRRSRWTTLALRLGYSVSLSAIAVLCAVFFFEQREQNRGILQIGGLSESLAKADEALLDLATYGAKLSERYADATKDDGASSADLRGMTLAEKRAALAARPVDPEVLSPVSGLKFRSSKARDALSRLQADWDAAPEDLKDFTVKTSRYMLAEDPFEHHVQLVSPERYEQIRFRADLYWSGRELQSLYESFINPTNLHLQEQFRAYLGQLSLSQGSQLERFLLITIGALVILGLFVFLPIDLTIGRMIRRLEDKSREAARAVKEAQAADRAKSEFLATMSHEIRTPMNGVLGMAELLTRSPLDTRQRTFTDVILKSGNALLDIINDILDFSKIDAGQLKLDIKPFNLTETVEDVAQLMSARTVEKDIEMIVRIDPALPPQLMGDKGRIRQILVNLTGNAIKFTEQGQVMIDLGWRAGPPTGEEGIDGTVAPGLVTISISDTGIGIPEDKLDSVFEKFSQVDSSSTRRHEGTGLGLAIVSRLIDLMGGRVTVDSTLGEGSVFTLSIPLAPVRAAVPAETRPAEVVGGRVLVVDDNAANRMILTEQAKSWGLDCVAVESGPMALQFLRHASGKLGLGIDLVILDFQMPDMTGADVAKAIRQDSAIAHTPILVLSSIDQADQLSALEGLALEAQLTKPVRMHELRKTAFAILARNAASSPARSQPPSVSDASSALKGPGEPGDAVAARSVATAVPDAGRPEPALPTKTLPEPVALPADQAERGKIPLVLVAEDNPVNQIVFQQILDTLGLPHALAVNGREAVEMWRRMKPSIVLMDVSMPDMNGHEATREIRRLESETGLDPVPVIAVTAHALQGDEDACHAAGMDDYLSKPVSPEKLAAMISRWLPGVSLEAEAA